ncbi:choriogenin Hminor [Colletotrichum tofieldiae]|nr:choriogenin Hminor [Colletotrichum tofieldiae]
MTSSKLSVSRASIKSSFGHFSFSSSQTNLAAPVSPKSRRKRHHSVSEPLHEQQPALADPGRLDASSYTPSRPPPPASPKRSQTDTSVKSPTTAAKINGGNLTLAVEENEKPAEPVLAPIRPPNNRKSRSWGNRLSALFPSLILQPTDQPQPQPAQPQLQHQLPIHRKPLPDDSSASSPSDSAPSYHTSENPTVRPVTSSGLGLGIAAPTFDSLDPPPPPPPFDAPPPVPGKTAHAPTYPQQHHLPLLPITL